MYLGIDIGSVSLKLALVDGRGVIHFTHYRRTEGRPVEALAAACEALEAATGIVRVDAAVATGSGKGLVTRSRGVGASNEILAHARAVSRLHPGVRTVIEIGGQDSKLILLDEQGALCDHAFNDLCAAGTGAFLDQQAARLGVGVDRLGRMANLVKRAVPVASRCAVFAKSDMIHHQQEGVSPNGVARGLCYALARNYLVNMLRGRTPPRRVAFCGGVAKNDGVRAAFIELLGLGPDDWVLPEHHHVMGAIGAALGAGAEWNRGRSPVDLEGLKRLVHDVVPVSPRRSPLPAQPRVDRAPPASARTSEVYLGLDLGSVSAKGVLVDPRGEVVARHYTLTEGQPLDALGRVLGSLRDQVTGSSRVLGCGVTGSGRMVAAAACRADTVRDEISAQLAASRALDPDVDTVFEIGGQDSKVLIVRDGQLQDFALNRICAAGTGSFLAEQAARLGVRIEDEFGERALRSRAPVDLGSRCTVFMDSDLIHHQQQGCATDDLLAGLSFSIAENFLEHVVEGRPVGERIWFQGGVAANPSVKAAFEALLGRPVRVHPHHALTGALGVALLAREEQRHRRTDSTFAGLEETPPRARTRHFTCQHCENQCEVVRVKIEDSPPLSFGGGCDRHERTDRQEDIRYHTRFYREARDELEAAFDNQPDGLPHEVGLPRALWTLTLAPFWIGFFNALGVRLVPSRKSNRQLYRRGLSGVLSEHCFGVKLAMGHVKDLIDRGVKDIFLPSYAGLPRTVEEQERGEGSSPCSYVQTLPDIARAGFPGIRLISPRLHLSRGPSDQDAGIFTREVGRRFGANRQGVERALAAGWTAWSLHRGRLRKIGERAVRETEGERVVVLAGHPYQLHDPLLSFSLPVRIAVCGATVIPADVLPWGRVQLGEEWSRMYWRANRDLLKLMDWLEDRPGMLPVLTTAFACGPDAFATRYLQEKRKDRPLLVLELDEHTAEAGLMTRLQAYLTNARTPGPKPARGFAPVPYRLKKFDGRVVYVPRFADHALVFKAAFLLEGLEAHVLPSGGLEALKRGRAWSSGRECNPFAYILGDLLALALSPGFDPGKARFFMPSSGGPCLLSQFPAGFELALSHLDIHDLLIDDPRSGDLQRNVRFSTLVRLWEGLVALEVLEQMLARCRPFESRRGAAQEAHDRNLADLERSMLSGDLAACLQRGEERLRGVTGPVDPDRPEVAIVGDIFTRINPQANADLHRRIESLGCTVRVPPFLTETVWHDAGEAVVFALRRGERTQALAAILLGTLQAFLGRRLQTTRGIGAGAGLRYLGWSWWAVERKLRDRLTHEVDCALAMNVALALDAVETGADAVINAMCHNCMVGMVSDTLFKRMAEEPGTPPVVTLAFDGLQETNTLTRLEAVCERAHLHKRGRLHDKRN